MHLTAYIVSIYLYTHALCTSCILYATLGDVLVILSSMLAIIMVVGMV